MYSLVTIRLELLFGRLGIEFGSYFVFIELINMRALPYNRETAWAAGVGGGVAAVVPGCRCNCCL